MYAQEKHTLLLEKVICIGKNGCSIAKKTGNNHIDEGI